MANTTLDFLVKTKREIKENSYRQTYDALLKEMATNLLNTIPKKYTIDQTQTTSLIVTVPKGNGSNDFMVLPKVSNSKGSDSDVPRAEVPIAFSKILVATAALASNVPDGQALSVNKIKARVNYELWKRSWAVVDMNGANTLDFAAQQLVGTGTTAWRQYPKQIVVDKTINGVKSKKILYDDIYREAMDMNRTWLGLSYKPGNSDGRPEILWEIDITKEEYKKLKEKFNKRSKKSASGTSVGMGTVSDEATQEDPNKIKTHVTITFYEYPKENRYIIASDDIVFYDGEMPNDEVYGSVIVAHCFHKDMVNPYGVGLYELIRGNQAIQNYVESLNVEQVAAEIQPIIFATGNIQGDMTFKRSSSKLNVLPAGVTIDKMTTTGNSTLGMNLIERLKHENDEITGVNDIVSGTSGAKTLGETVILKEAALNRLMKPRNSLARALERDFCIFSSWLEQDQINEREFIFATPEEVNAFQQLNPMFHNEAGKTEYNEDGITVKSQQVFSSQRIPLSFDINNPDLTESGYQNQNIQETGANANMISRASALQTVRSLEAPDKIGYDKVYLKIDANSMLVPSFEIQKQTAMQLFPIIQNTIMQVFGLARQDPEQAKAQLKAFNSFMEVQKLNTFDYIPKDLYDQIMQASMAPTPEQLMQQQQQQALIEQAGMDPAAGATGADGTPVGMPQNANEMSTQQSNMGQAVNGGITNMGAKNAVNAMAGMQG